MTADEDAIVERLIWETPDKGMVAYTFQGDTTEMDDPELVRADEQAAISVIFEGAAFGADPTNVMGFREPQEFGSLLAETGLPWGGRYRRLAGPDLFEAYFLLIPTGGVTLGGLLKLVGIWLSHRNEPEVEIRWRDGIAVRVKGAGANLAEAEQTLRGLLGPDGDPET